MMKDCNGIEIKEGDLIAARVMLFSWVKGGCQYPCCMQDIVSYDEALRQVGSDVEDYYGDKQDELFCIGMDSCGLLGGYKSSEVMVITETTTANEIYQYFLKSLNEEQSKAIEKM